MRDVLKIHNLILAPCSFTRISFSFNFLDYYISFHPNFFLLPLRSVSVVDENRDAKEKLIFKVYTIGLAALCFSIVVSKAPSAFFHSFRLRFAVLFPVKHRSFISNCVIHRLPLTNATDMTDLELKTGAASAVLNIHSS